MENILREYVGFIRAFENSLKIKYNTSKNPCTIAGSVFERKGTINGIDYWFHGSGCTAEKDSVIYAYDISAFVENEIEFSLWKFSEFIRTHPKYSLLKYSSEDIENELAKLIDKGILSWLVIMGRTYKTYRVVM
ncbi:hypothetical protein GCM10008015_03020 [Flavobacterium palustre]|uniref:DUF6896 domain-containing protein n=1 Tax=Flavobacterium palustre TaxID=1476463 RepID=A0ABQ1H958_9FLAO|nr:hypothetical protein [Flavobacterium palustre]GGA65649.1 hypothetical protein GCM10008015_03020 [Flavobacterium palustre]